MVRVRMAVCSLALASFVACQRTRAPANGDARADGSAAAPAAIEPDGDPRDMVLATIRMPPREAPTIRVERDRVVVTTSRGVSVVPNVDGAVDEAALSAVLAHPRSSTIELADDASFQQLVTVMNVGGRDKALLPPGDYPTQPSRPVPEPFDLDTAPIVIVTKETISVLRPSSDGKPSIRDVATVAEAARTPGYLLPALAAELERIDPPGLAIIQADRVTTGRLVNQIVRTTRTLGMDRTLFAIRYTRAADEPAATPDAAP